MSDSIPLQTPAGFAPAFALGLDDGTGHLALVSDARPLPVMSLSASNSGPAAAPQPLAGETSVSVRVGPFAPAPGRTIVLTLSGEWEGTVRLLRSVDNGVTCHPLTLAGAPWGQYAANACEPVWTENEEAATLWLECSVTQGTLSYRVAQ
ncbi:hypothetical protein [Qipengyuania sp.]|uniref:hypothetical protein n=1 Tax=Qipengyuania sp. TaxID=2004515 RepID=UPI003736CA7C